MAGLMAARVLCNHFIHVIVVKRDVYPDGIGSHNGTPQSNQVHVLLLKDKQILVEEIQRYQNGLKNWV
jgi:ribulose 1,5-bisphosphate synthetase/thiazole synthase